MDIPKNRKPLNANQKDILLALYKFRFVTRELLVEYLGLTSPTYTHYRLTILREQKIIDRRYSGEDKIQSRWASYLILPAGLRILRTIPDLNSKVLDNMYRDRKRGQSSINSCLSIFQIYNRFQKLYSNNLEFYSQSELAEYTFFPKKLPDGYILLSSKQYMLEYLPSTTTYQSMRGRMGQLVNHFESDSWKVAGTDYPTTLFVCENVYLERQIQRIAKRSIQRDEDIDFDDMPMRTTTIKALLGSPNKEVAIWSDVEDPDDLITLQPTATS